MKVKSIHTWTKWIWKSTLLNLISGVLTTTHGKLKVLDQELCSLNNSLRDKLRGEKIGYIFQIFNLIPYLSIKENIILPCLINKQRNQNNLEAQAAELIKTLGLKDIADKEVSNLSIGQQQRVAAARSLIGNPKLIIADEPTSSLDEKTLQISWNYSLVNG